MPNPFSDEGLHEFDLKMIREYREHLAEMESFERDADLKINRNPPPSDFMDNLLRLEALIGSAVRSHAPPVAYRAGPPRNDQAALDLRDDVRLQWGALSDKWGKLLTKIRKMADDNHRAELLLKRSKRTV